MGVTHFAGLEAGASGLYLKPGASAHQIVSAVKSVSKAVLKSAMTDGGGTSGYIDFDANAIPALSLVLGWKFVTSVAFNGDTSATVQVGVSGTVAKYSAVTSGSVFAAGTVGSICATTATVLDLAAATPRITITSAADFTSVAAGGAGVCTLYYIPLL